MAKFYKRIPKFNLKGFSITGFVYDYLFLLMGLVLLAFLAYLSFEIIFSN